MNFIAIEAVNRTKDTESLEKYTTELDTLIGCDSPDRRKIIKKAFKTIIDMFIPGRTRILIKLLSMKTKVSDEELVALYRMSHKDYMIGQKFFIISYINDVIIKCLIFCALPNIRR